MYKVEVLSRLEDVKACFHLGKKHYKEVEEEFSHLPYQPNEKMIERLFEAGMLSIVVVFDGPILVGYVGNIISPDIFTDSLHAREVGMYVRPDYRGKGVFKALLEGSKSELTKLGVDSHFIVFKEGYEHTVPEGYEKTETVYRFNFGGS